MIKMGSEEYFKVLREYKTSNRVEEIMVELLLIPEEADDEIFAAMTYKICEELTVDQIDTLDTVMKKIKDELGIA